MFLKQFLAPFAAYILRSIKTHKNRKRFAKILGKFFEGTKAKTAYGFTMISKWHDNMNRISFEGSYGIVADFIADIPGNSIFIDIGANQGCTSILASRVLENRQNDGVVIAFEPSPSSYKLMLRNINLNQCNNIFTFNRAVSSKKTKLYLDETDTNNSGASHISEKGNLIFAAPIKVKDVKSISKYNNIYLKIDTEGYEMHVLKGLNELFEQNFIRKIVIEIDDINLNKYGNNPKEIYDFLDMFGFRPIIGLNKGHYDEVFIEKK